MQGQNTFHLFKESVFFRVKEQWATDIWTKPKLRTFRMINNEYSAENYVEYNLSKKAKISMCPAEMWCFATCF